VSRRQIVTALRVAAVPAGTFKQGVESEDPPTITDLTKPRRRADLGRPRRRPPTEEMVMLTLPILPPNNGMTIEERAIEQQVHQLMAVWHRTDREARLRFLRHVGCRCGNEAY
jgi:hypothetical protein